MRILTLTLLASLAQDEARIAEWIRDLGNDAPDVRLRAMEKLVEAGEKAVPELRKAARKGGNPEILSRASQALAEIERRARAREFDRGPSFITLRLEDAPLKEVLEEIGKQTPTKLSFEDIPGQDKVTVAFDKRTLFSALDDLCRSHGGVDFWVEEDWGEDGEGIVDRMVSGGGGSSMVRIAAMKYGLHPRTVHRQFVINLSSIRFWTQAKPDGTRDEKTVLTFGVGWEKGTRPLAIQTFIDDVKDDLGRSYRQDFKKGEESLFDFGRAGSMGIRFVNRTPAAQMDRLPAAGAQKLVLVKGAIEITLPEAKEVYPFPAPEEELGQIRKGPSGQVKLVSFSRIKEALKVTLEVRPASLDKRLVIRLRDKEGKEHVFHRGRGSGNPELMTRTLEYEIPEGIQGLKIECVARTGKRSIRVPFEFRDIRIR